jgi:hypothetical protein
MDKWEMANMLERLAEVVRANPSITDRSYEGDILRPIFHDNEMELMLVDGAMAAVGESTPVGLAVELRFSINYE